MSFNAQQSPETGFPSRLLVNGHATIIIRLVEKHDQKQPYRIQDGVNPESPTPVQLPGHESSCEGTQIRGQDDSTRPPVDLPRMLVEKEHVLDPHQATSLRANGEEAIEDSCSQK